MNATEMMKIKEYQRDFQKIFGKKLYINWPEMKGVKPRGITEEVERDEVTIDLTAEEILNEVVAKHNTTVEAVRDRKTRVHVEARENDRNALIEFARIIVKSHKNRNKAAQLINRDRTTLYHFAKKEYGKKM
jgi:hypothetical protein